VDLLSRSNWDFEIEFFSGGRKTTCKLLREKPLEGGQSTTWQSTYLMYGRRQS